MGADGGLNWVYAKNKDAQKRAFNLLQPLLIRHNFRDEDDEYLDNNPIEDTAIISRYGTDIDDNGLDELPELLRDKTNFFDYTFSDVCIDLATMPEWQIYKISPIQKAVFRVAGFLVYYKYFQYSHFRMDPHLLERREKERTELFQKGMHYLGILIDIKVSDWIEELKSNLYWDKIDSVETWT